MNNSIRPIDDFLPIIHPSRVDEFITFLQSQNPNLKYKTLEELDGKRYISEIRSFYSLPIGDILKATMNKVHSNGVLAIIFSSINVWESSNRLIIENEDILNSTIYTTLIWIFFNITVGTFSMRYFTYPLNKHLVAEISEAYSDN